MSRASVVLQAFSFACLTLVLAGCASSPRSASRTTTPTNLPISSTTVVASTVAASTTTTTLPASVGGLPPSGFYIDGSGLYPPSDNYPHYVLSVAASVDGVDGWLFFVYQDGHTREVFHYSGRVTSGQSLRLTTLDPNGFPYSGRGSTTSAGDTTKGGGNTFMATYSDGVVTLTDCSSYLYWANPSGGKEASTCSFVYDGANA